MPRAEKCPGRCDRGPGRCAAGAKRPGRKYRGGLALAQTSRAAHVAHSGRGRTISVEGEGATRAVPAPAAAGRSHRRRTGHGARHAAGDRRGPRRLGKTVVLSAHAIEQSATPAQIARWVGRFRPLPATVLKIAARIKSWRDLQQLAALLVNHPEWPLAVMGLGPLCRAVALGPHGARLAPGLRIPRPRRRARPALGGRRAQNGTGGAKSRRSLTAPTTATKARRTAYEVSVVGEKNAT